MRLEEMMSPGVVTAVPSVPVLRAKELMRQRGIGHLAVVEGGELVGSVSLRAIKHLDDEILIGEVMDKDPVRSKTDTTVREAANRMRAAGADCTHVFDDGRLCGIVTTTDLLDALGRAQERPVTRGKRWTLRNRGPRQKSPGPRISRGGGIR